jgi:hypothetical protein
MNFDARMNELWLSKKKKKTMRKKEKKRKEIKKEGMKEERRKKIWGKQGGKQVGRKERKKSREILYIRFCMFILYWARQAASQVTSLETNQAFSQAANPVS